VGNGVYGAASSCRTLYRKDASSLTPIAAGIAAIFVQSQKKNIGNQFFLISTDEKLNCV
jgi:hypothetical protein